MPTILDLEDDDPYVALLIYARSGAGKTVFAGSDDDVLFLNTEKRGTLSAKRQGSTAKKINGNTWNKCVATKNWLTELGEKDKIPYKWFVVDTLTNLQRLNMIHQISAANQNVKEKARQKSTVVPEMSDYLVNQHELIRFVEEVNELPVNVLWLCHASIEIDEDGNNYVLPAIHGKEGKIAQAICAMQTSFGHMKVVQAEVTNPTTKKKSLVIHRDIWWIDKGSTTGKDRTGVLAPKTRNLTLKQIRERIEAGPKPKVAAE